MTKNTAQIVPVGTKDVTFEVISPIVQTYLDRYNFAIRKTAQSVLELAATLLEAQEELGPVDFTIFLREVGFNEDSSTFKKFIAIAKKKHALEPHLEKLPNAWTTIYQLAKLNSDQFEDIANSGLLTPYLTGNAINNMLRASIPNGNSRAENDVFISVQSMPVETQFEFYQALEALCAEYNAPHRLSKPMTKLMADYKQKVA